MHELETRNHRDTRKPPPSFLQVWAHTLQLWRNGAVATMSGCIESAWDAFSHDGNVTYQGKDGTERDNLIDLPSLSSAIQAFTEISSHAPLKDASSSLTRVSEFVAFEAAIGKFREHASKVFAIAKCACILKVGKLRQLHCETKWAASVLNNFRKFDGKSLKVEWSLSDKLVAHMAGFQEQIAEESKSADKQFYPSVRVLIDLISTASGPTGGGAANFNLHFYVCLLWACGGGDRGARREQLQAPRTRPSMKVIWRRALLLGAAEGGARRFAILPLVFIRRLARASSE